VLLDAVLSFNSPGSVFWVGLRADLIFYPSYWVLHVLLFHMTLWICASIMAHAFKQ